jgi:ParB family transcriptional regulator, chromosome partitioning protein
MSKGLVKGLEALIPSVERVMSVDRDAGVIKVPVKKIKPNRYQPRKKFSDDRLQELAKSIGESGVIQPVVVTECAVPGEYELIVGERRLRAAEIAGLAEVPAIVRTVSDKERYQISLVENLQREDLNPIEKAKAYRDFSEKFELTQESLSKLVGYDRAVVANTMRLLNLPEEIQDMISEGVISQGHGRVLAGLENGVKLKGLAERIIREKLTVREIEEIVKNWKTYGPPLSARKKRPAEIIELENDLQKSLGTRVRVAGRGKKGRITIFFWSLDELDRLLKVLRSGAKTHRAAKK